MDCSNSCPLGLKWCSNALPYRGMFSVKCLPYRRIVVWYLRYAETSIHSRHSGYAVQLICRPTVDRHFSRSVHKLHMIRYSYSNCYTQQLPNLHNTKMLNISGMRWDMTKRKMSFFFTFKGLSNSPIFQYLNFSFHRHLKRLLAKLWTAFKLNGIILN